VTKIIEVTDHPDGSSERGLADMSGLKIYVDMMSQPCRALVIFARMNKIPFEFKQTFIKEGMNKTPEFTAIHPFQKLPAAEHNNVPMFESLAIMRYLAATHEVADHWYPKDPMEKLRIDQYLDWQHHNTRLNCAMYFQNKWLQPLLQNRPVNQKQVDKSLKAMEDTLANFENFWLDGGKKNYIGVKEQISVADIWACCELEQPSMAGYDVREGRPVLKAYMDRVISDLSPEYDDAHKIVRMMVKKFGGKIPGRENEKPVSGDSAEDVTMSKV